MKSIIVFIACFIAISSSAQTLKVTPGTPISAKDLAKMTGNIMYARDAITPSFFFDLSSKRAYGNFAIGGGKLLGYNDFVTPADIKKFSAEFVDDEKGQYVSILSLLNLNSKLYAFYMTLDKKKDEISVYVNEVSNELVLMGSPILIHRYKNLEDDGSDVDFRYSPNNKYFLLTRILDRKLKEPMQFECTLIDEGFGQVANQSFKTDYSDRSAFVNIAKVDDGGNFYIVESAADRSAGSKLRPQLHLYNFSQKKMSKIGLGLADGSTYGVNAMVNKNNQLIVVGLNKTSRAVRCFKQTLDPVSGTITQDQNSLMPDHYYKDYTIRSFKAGDWRIANIVSLDNGTVVATAEAQLNLVDQMGNPAGSTGHNTYVLSFKNDGKVNFNTIYKKQETMKPNCGSALIASQNKFFVIYNDNSKNMKRKPEDRKVDIYYPKNCMIVVQEFDEAGKVTKYPLLKGDKFKTYNANITQLASIGNGQYFFSAFNKQNLANFNNMAVVIAID